MEKIFVFGHRKPDTDSITAAIALSHLKNELGFNTVPMTLGELNNETKFVLDYFKVPTPKLLEDVRLQIKDLKYEKNCFVEDNTPIYDAFNYMNKNSISNVPVIDKDKYFLGTASMKDISKDLITGNVDEISTTYENIKSVLNAKELLKFDDEISGNVLVASYRSTTFIENIDLSNNDILIVGDRHSIIEYAVMKKVKLLILTGSSRIKDEHLEIAKKNKVNILKTELSTFNAARMFTLSKPISAVMNSEDIICFNENDEVNDFIDTANKTKYSYFPVVNNKNKCLGTVKLADAAFKIKKQVILVDHNEYEQSVDGLEEADIVEIIDHHKIGSIGTSAPINFRNMPVGSTNTILYLMYKENRITIPKEIAGLMLSGIISDTLLFASPTTTDLDKEAVENLAKLAGVNYRDYGMEMFKAGSSLAGKTTEQILYTDFKKFNIENRRVGIGQVSTTSPTDILNIKEEYINMLNDVAVNNEYNVVALFVTDIINNGSYILYSDNSEKIFKECYGEDLEEAKFLPGIVSRKKQIIPTLMDYI